MTAVVCLGLGYCIGCINPAAWIAKKKHVNLKKEGTGNLGATNTAYVMGKKAGYFVLFFDRHFFYCIKTHIKHCQGSRLWYLSQLFNLYAEYIIRNAGLDEAQAGIKITGRNINNLSYADDTTLMAESKEELKSFLMKVKEESEKAGLKLNIQKTKIMACGSITSWQIMDTVTDFISWAPKITAAGD